VKQRRFKFILEFLIIQEPLRMTYTRQDIDMLFCADSE